MKSAIFWLAVLFAFTAFTAWRAVQLAKKADAAEAHYPKLPSEFEHECDAPYPRVGD